MRLCTRFDTKKHAECYCIGLRYGFEGQKSYPLEAFPTSERGDMHWFNLGMADAKAILKPHIDNQDSLYEELKRLQDRLP